MIPPRRRARLGPAPSHGRSAFRGSTILALMMALRAAAEAGDRARFDRLFEHAFARVYRWAWRQCGGEVAHAERLTEDTLSRLLTASGPHPAPTSTAARQDPLPRRKR